MAVIFRLLGAVEARVDASPVDLGPARQRCVLAALLVDANRLVSVDQLVGRVWADRPPYRARDTLYSYLSRLRHALPGGPPIERIAGGYVLRVPPDEVDLHYFRRLVTQARAAEDDKRAAALFEEALGLWHGDALADLDTPWAHGLREALHAERWAAELDRTDLLLRQGRHAELVADLAARAREHPLDERLAGQLVLALYRGGRQADALQHFEQTRHRLAEELGADPSPSLRELHQQILRGELTSPVVRQEPEPVPLQFPAAPGSFVGRADELAALSAACDAQVTRICALAGAGGIGKTWLVLHWAHTHRERFPDGQLFVDLHGFSSGNAPLEPPVVVRGFLDALGVAPDRIPPDPPAQAAMYRSLVAGKRMLIVLDNAADDDQVIPLLPGSPAATVLVTSRRHLTTLITRHGARHLQLDSLAEREAHALLTERLGPARVAAEPEATAELIRLCGRYPLALAIMSRHAHTRPHIPLADFATELRDLGLDALDNAHDPSVSLPTVLSWSLRGLTAEQRTVFALVGIAPGPDLGLPAAASLTGLSLRQTSKVLGALEEASLLARRPGGRYAMHDLIRDYATTTADNDLGQDALRRLLDFYTHTAYAADHLLAPHRPAVKLEPPAPGTCPVSLSDDSAAIAWFDREHANLLAAQHIAAARGWHEIVWELAWALPTYQDRRGHRHDRLAVWQAALKAAPYLADPSASSCAHRHLATACATLGRDEDAIEHMRQALAMAEQNDDITEQALAHHGLAWISERLGDGQDALGHATRGLDLFRTMDHPVWEARALNAVGWYASRLGDYDTARAHCQDALSLHRKHNDPDGEAGTLGSLGNIEHRTGHHDLAIDYYRQAITLFRDCGGTYQVADTLDHLGHSHAALGCREEARTVWQEALELYRQQGRVREVERVQKQLDSDPI